MGPILYIHSCFFVKAPARPNLGRIGNSGNLPRRKLHVPLPTQQRNHFLCYIFYQVVYDCVDCRQRKHIGKCNFVDIYIGQIETRCTRDMFGCRLHRCVCKHVMLKALCGLLPIPNPHIQLLIIRIPLETFSCYLKYSG